MRFKILVVVIALAASGSTLAVDKGDAAPAWQGKDFDGRVVEFPAVVAGKPTVIVFWATWCPYCKAFMPYLAEIQAEYGSDRVAVVAVNAKQDRAKNDDPRAYIDGLGFALTAVRDGDAIAAAYDVEFIPGLLVIDGDGTVAYQRGWTDLPAGKTVSQQWADEVREALAQSL